MQTILPPSAGVATATEPDHALLFDPDALPPAYAFTPVPRQTKRWNGITPVKQRQFIAHLAACGSVTMAARAIAASPGALYQLRKGVGAESFAAAWEAAVDAGARHVLDTLVDHAIHGTPERLLKDGQVILERRKYNTRAMMWIVQQRFPDQYGGALNPSAPNGCLPQGLQRLKDKWRAEWEEEQSVAAATAAATATATATDAETTRARIAEYLGDLFAFYRRRLIEERSARLAGRTVAADFTMRQLAYIEIVLHIGGIDIEDLENANRDLAQLPGPKGEATALTRHLDHLRRAVWDQADDAPRPAAPALEIDPATPGHGVWGGPTIMTRMRTQREPRPLLFEFGGERRRSGVPERGVRPLVVVIIDPAGEDRAGLPDREEQRLVEQLVAHATIEALHEPVLRWLPGCDIMPLDPDIARPG